MIENIRIMFYSVSDKVAEKLVETLGWSVATSLAIVFKLSFVETINGILETIVLIISIAVGVSTFIYTRRKMKKLGK